MSVVLDCSIAMNWVMPDESSPFAEKLLERVAVEGGTVPLLFKIEVGNALLIAVRRKRITDDVRSRAFEKIGALPLEQDEQGARNTFGRIASILRKRTACRFTIRSIWSSPNALKNR